MPCIVGTKERLCPLSQENRKVKAKVLGVGNELNHSYVLIGSNMEFDYDRCTLSSCLLLSTTEGNISPCGQTSSSTRGRRELTFAIRQMWRTGEELQSRRQDPFGAITQISP